MFLLILWHFSDIVYCGASSVVFLLILWHFSDIVYCGASSVVFLLIRTSTTINYIRKVPQYQ